MVSCLGVSVNRVAKEQVQVRSDVEAYCHGIAEEESREELSGKKEA